jgi:hypothetical protein
MVSLAPLVASGVGLLAGSAFGCYFGWRESRRAKESLPPAAMGVAENHLFATEMHHQHDLVTEPKEKPR